MNSFSIHLLFSVTVTTSVTGRLPVAVTINLNHADARTFTQAATKS